MDSKTSSPEGITVAAATPNRITNTPLTEPIPPHRPVTWVEVAEGAAELIPAAEVRAVCPVCGAAAVVDESRIFAEGSSVTGWLDGLVPLRCTADPSHDAGDLPFRREYLALISERVREWAVNCATGSSAKTVLYRAWADPRVHLAGEESLPADDGGNPIQILAYLCGRAWPNPLVAARQWLAHRGEEETPARLREAVWEAIREQIEERDGQYIGYTVIDEGDHDDPDATYAAWIEALTTVDGMTLMERIRAAPAYRVVCEKRDIAICPVCYENDDGEFVTVDGTRYCRVCGAEYVDSPMAWDDDRREEREFEEPVEVAPMEADASAPQQFRLRSHCDAWGICPECNDKKGIFVEDANGDRVCAKCGFNFDSIIDDEAQWTEDELDSERIPVTAENVDFEVD